MKKTVKLRNGNGEFCTLGEWCKSQAEPWLVIPDVTLPTAGETLNTLRKLNIRFNRAKEVIEAFELRRGIGAVNDRTTLCINADGTYCGNLGCFETRLKIALIIAKELAEIWNATEYIVDEKE